MKRFFWLLVILLIAVVLGIIVSRVPGYVLIQLGSSSVTAPLWLSVLALVIVCLVAYFLIRLLRLFYLVPKGWRLSFLKSRASKRESTLKSGLSAYLVGDFETAKKRFKELAKHQYLAPESWFLTASAAQLAGERPEAIDALKQAAQLKFKDRTYLTLLEVDRLIEEEKWALASQKLEPILHAQSKSLPALKRALAVEKGRQNWPGVIDLLPRLRKAFDSSTVTDWQIESYQGLLHLAQSADRAKVVWLEIPKQLQLDKRLLTSYVRTLSLFKAYTAADEILTKHLSKDFSGELFLEYSRLPLDGAIRLKQGEEWFQSHAPSVNSLNAMGNLYAHHRILTKAEDCFERAKQL